MDRWGLPFVLQPHGSGEITKETAKDVYRTLVAHNLQRTSKSAPTLTFKATGDAESFEKLARRFLGPEVTKVEEIR